MISNNEVNSRVAGSYEVPNNVLAVMPDPLVTVRTSTYQHGGYIRECIEGVLMQKTDFPVEYIIGEDCSTDGTRETVMDYARNYPNQIRVLTAKKNVGSKANSRRCINASRGKYIAHCEGDDCWTDPNKLQKQVEALERNPSIDMAIHPALAINLKTGEEGKVGVYKAESGVVPLSDIIVKKFGQIPTASTVIRKSVCERYNEFTEANPYLMVGDIYIHIFGAERGGAWYSSEVSSVYRMFVEGSWKSNQTESVELRVKHLRARIDSFVALKCELSSDWHRDIDDANKKCLFVLVKQRGIGVIEKLRSLRKYHSVLNLAEKASAFVLCLMPGVVLNLSSKIKKFLFARK